MNLVSLLVSRSTFLKGLVLSTTAASFRQPSSPLLPPTASPTIALQETYLTTSQQIRNEITRLVRDDPSLTGPFVRLAFHDAATFEDDTGGSNGSILYELERSENRGLRKPLEILRKLRSESPSIQDFSLADTIALAGAASLEAIGGPSIPIRLGRPDVETADPKYLREPLEMPSKIKYSDRSSNRTVIYDPTSRSLVTTTLPSAALDSDGLRLYFGRLGLSEAEFVALSGTHGLGRHVSLLNMTKSCLKNLTRDCLEEAPVLLPFVTSGVDRFDTSYFEYLLKWNAQQVELGQVAFIPTDVALVVDPGLQKYVKKFASNPRLYRRTLCRAYQILVDRTATTTRRY